MASDANMNLFYFGIILPTALLLCCFVIFVVAWYKCRLKDRLLTRHTLPQMAEDHQHRTKCSDCNQMVPVNKEELPSKLVLRGPNKDLKFDHIDSDKTPEPESTDGYVALFIPSTSDHNTDFSRNCTGSWLLMTKYDNYGYLQPRMYLRNEYAQALSAQLLQNTLRSTEIELQLENVDNLRLSVGSHSSDGSGDSRMAYRNMNNNTLASAFSSMTRFARAKANKYITDRSTSERMTPGDSNHRNSSRRTQSSDGNHRNSNRSTPSIDGNNRNSPGNGRNHGKSSRKQNGSPNRYINEKTTVTIEELSNRHGEPSSSSSGRHAMTTNANQDYYMDRIHGINQDTSIV